MMIVARAPNDFSDWQGLLDLILLSFAYMEGRIDPPSSAHLLTLESLRQKANHEYLYLSGGAPLTGCAFFSARRDALYIGKVAIHPAHQRAGLGRAFMDQAHLLARCLDLPKLMLETRIELSELHEAYSRMGFVKTAETAHPGFDRPTSITMERALRPL